MSLRLNSLSESNAQDLEHLCAISDDVFGKILATLSEVDEVPLRTVDLSRLTKSFMSADQHEAFMRQIIAMGKLQREYEYPSTEIMSGLAEVIRGSSRVDGWKKEWPRVAEHLRSLLDTNAIQGVIKATDLALDHQRLLLNSRLITDVRPVFNDERDVLIGAVVHNVLRIRFLEDHSTRNLTFLLDEDDIRKLHAACERALKKTEQMKDLMRVNCNVQTFTLDEGLNDDS
jgi:hypothetical protein